MAKRRSNGEGNIRKRKDGRWEGRYTAGRDPVTGKQIFKNVLGKTQAEVKEKLQKALAQAGKIDFAKTGKYTVTMWMNEWFENVAKIKVRPSSHQTYRGYIDHHIAPNIGNIPLEKLTKIRFISFPPKYSMRLSDTPPLTHKTITQHIISIMCFFFSPTQQVPSVQFYGDALVLWS